MRTDHTKTADASAPVNRLKVGFVLSRSFTLSAFAMFVDTLRLASDEDDRSGRVHADWQVLGSTRHLITSSCGIQVAPTSDFVDPSRYDYIVVVGGLLSVKDQVDAETIAFIKRAAHQKVPLIGLCTGTFILAEAGLMKGHVTCVSWLHARAFQERFPDLQLRSDRIFNLDRRRGSCAGGSSSADIAAALVRRHISPHAEKKALEVLQIVKARSAADVQPRRALEEKYEDPRIRAVIIKMEQHLDQELDMGDLGSAVGLSQRQLERLFQKTIGTSPARAFGRIRMERAKLLLAQSSAPLIEIALDVGYRNSAHFSRAFKREFGHTPSSLRSRKTAVTDIPAPRGLPR
ncbi:GlxA family transcriptional regulator [Rhizobium panacihumi]|uniref:GlxA family transcriptional regulator n=1 Tax=Rhizobium panacihumi TaxID=2008450 RepID=UPI003D7B5583